MAIRLNLQRSADNGVSWTTHVSAVLAPYTGSLAVPPLAPGTYQIRAQSYDDADGSAPSAWSAATTYTVERAPSAMIVYEGEISVNGGAWTHAFERLDETRWRLELGGYGHGTSIALRVRRRDLSDGSAPSAWSTTLSITVSAPTAAPVASIGALPLMRGLSAGERTLMDGRDYLVRHQLLVRDDDGTWRDVSALLAEDFFVGARWEDGDAPVTTLALDLLREVERRDGTVFSLAPFMTGSAINVRASNNTYAPLLQHGRAVQLRTAVIARGTEPVAGDWVTEFDGRLDDPDWGAAVIRVSARDWGAALQDTMVTAPKRYGSDAGVPLATVMREILADTGHGNVTLAVVGDPNWHLRPFEQAAGVSVLDALQSLALQIGWSVRYRPTDRATWQLALYAPSRSDVSGTTADLTLVPSRYLDVPSFATVTDGVRNIVRVAYLDAASKQAETVEVQHANSIARHGRRFMQLALGAASNIRTRSEAQTFADLALADLAEPAFRAQIDRLYHWAPQPGAVVSLGANTVHHDTAQKAAIVGVVREITRTRTRMTLTLRGRAQGAYQAWLRREGPPSPALGPLAIRAKATPVAADDTSLTVRLTGEVTRGGVPVGQVAEVAITAVADGVTVLEGPAIGVRAPSGTLWRLARPASRVPGSFVYRAQVPGASAEDRAAVPQQGVSIEGLAALVWSEFGVVAAASTATVTRVRGVLTDPAGKATGSATVSVTRTGPITTVTPVSPGSPPALPVTGPLPLTVEFDVPRQAFQSGESIVEAQGSAPGVQGDWERVVIHAVERDTVTLAPRLVRAGGTATTESYHVEHGAVPAGVGAISYATSGTATVASGAGTVASPWVVNRPAFNGGGARFTVTASATGAASGSDGVDVQPQEDVSATRRVVVSSRAFRAADEATTTGSYSLAHMTNTSAAARMFEAPVILPTGATLTAVVFHYLSSAANQHEFAVRVTDAALASSSIASGFGGNTNSIAASLAFVLSRSVATETELVLQCTMAASGTGAQLFRAVVEYTAPGLNVSL